MQQREGLSLRTSGVQATTTSGANVKWALSSYLSQGEKDDGQGFRSIPFAVRGQKLCAFQPKYDRYMNVVPYEQNRVKLRKSSVCDHDYINASHVRSKRDDLAQFSYIASQGPVDETIGDFWMMVCQQKVTAIVMLCDLVEDMMLKCAQYFPLAEGETVRAGNFVVRAVHAETLCPGVEHRVLEVLGTWGDDSGGGTRRVDHYRYSDWPDHGIPEPRVHASNIEAHQRVPPLVASRGALQCRNREDGHLLHDRHCSEKSAFHKPGLG
jgi:protein tyrosine phosphatase